LNNTELCFSSFEIIDTFVDGFDKLMNDFTSVTQFKLQQSIDNVSNTIIFQVHEHISFIQHCLMIVLKKAPNDQSKSYIQKLLHMTNYLKSIFSQSNPLKINFFV